MIPGGFKLGDIVQHSSGFDAVVSSEHVTSNPDRYVPVKVLADYGDSCKAGDRIYRALGPDQDRDWPEDPSDSPA